MDARPRDVRSILLVMGMQEGRFGKKNDRRRFVELKDSSEGND